MPLFGPLGYIRELIPSLRKLNKLLKNIVWGRHEQIPQHLPTLRIFPQYLLKIWENAQRRQRSIYPLILDQNKPYCMN